MTNTTIFVIATLTGLLLVTVGAQNAFSGVGGTTAEDSWEEPISGAKAIPSWVQFNMQSYLDGLISERELLDAFKFLEDKGIMHKSQEAAQEMADLRAENAELRSMETHKSITSDLSGDRMMQPGSQIDPSQTPVIVMPASEEEAINHLRKAYDLDPNLETKVVQYDKDHDKWIDVLSIDWGTSTASQTPKTDFGSVLKQGASKTADTQTITFTGLELASDTIHDLVSNGETSTTGWDEGVAAFTKTHLDSSSSSADSVVDDLSGIVVLCSTAIEKEILKVEAEIAILEELSDRQSEDSTARSGSTTQYGESDMEFIVRHLERIDTKILSLQTGLSVLEDRLATMGEDAQLANIDLQNALQKQQQSLQMLSNISKIKHDTAKAAISNVR